MLITTNDYFQDKEIEAYLGQVNEQIVIGANIFKDVFASFRDVFGGQTKGYKKELDRLKHAAIRGLEKQAKGMKANAIIAFNMDIDEISGGGKSMFMVNVYGTAVRFKEGKREEAVVLGDGRVSSELIDYEVHRKILQDQIKKGAQPFSDISADDLIKYNIYGIFVEGFNYNSFYEGKDKVIEYLKVIPEEEIASMLLTSVKEFKQNFWENLLAALGQRDWFDGEVIMKMLKHEDPIVRYRGVHLCTVDKSYYERKHISQFSDISAYLNDGFDPQPEITVEEGTFKSKEYWRCPRCLHMSKMDQKKCECGGYQPHGLKDSSLEKLQDILTKRATVLQEVFQEN